MENRVPAILVIDDDNHVCRTIESVLKRKQFDVVVARDGHVGIGTFKAMKFDAVVIDIFMPEMDGIATIRELRDLDPSIPIIAMSGRAFTDAKDGAPDFLGMAVKLGADHGLQKPFRSDELVDAILCCLAARKAPECPGCGTTAAEQQILRRVS
jgi:two-component system response regulator (stage 0 sporulation protein F)